MDASLLKNIARTAFDHGGGLRYARWVNRKALRILMYHRFHDRPALARQLRHIRESYSPVSMSQVASMLADGATLPDQAIAVTVDDGYRDFYQVAYPVFREYGIPVTVYLVSQFVDRKLYLWLDQLRYAFLHSNEASYRLEIGGESRTLPLTTREAREAAAQDAGEMAKKLSNGERLRFMKELPEQLRIAIPAEAPAEYEAMRWEEVREMAAQGIEFGAHTRTHPILSRLGTRPELDEEIAGSKREIEEQLGRAVDHFCYPNGSSADFGAQAVASVRQAGYRTAVTTEKGVNLASTDPFRLLRIGVQPDLDDAYFQRCAAAFRV